MGEIGKSSYLLNFTRILISRTLAPFTLISLWSIANSGRPTADNMIIMMMITPVNKTLYLLIGIQYNAFPSYFIKSSYLSLVFMLSQLVSIPVVEV